MDLVRARVTLRERSLLDVLDLAVRFVVDHGVVYARLSLVTLLPAFALSWAASMLGGWVFAWLVAFALSALADAPFVALASRLVFSERVRVGDSLRASMNAIARVLGVRAIQGAGLAGSSALFGLPWLWLGGALLFTPEVVLLEQMPMNAAFGRAYGLAKSQLGLAAATMLLLSVLMIASALLADAAGAEVLREVLQVRPPASVFSVGGSPLALFGFWASLPFRTTTRFFAYLDIRTRTEGWDIQTRFAALAAREAAEVAALADASPPARSGV